MLAGTVYFYDKNEVLIKEIDIEEYEDLTEDEFMRLIDEVKAHKVLLGAYYHNHQASKTTLLYVKDKKQT